MQGSTRGARLVLAMGWVVCLAGCVGLTAAVPEIAARRHLIPKAAPGPDLRIPVEALAQGPQIPLVPVPPPPLYQGKDRPPVTPAAPPGGSPADPPPPPVAPAAPPASSPPATAPAATTPPASPPAAASTPEGSTPEGSTPELRDVYRQATESYARIDSYIARLTRREEVRGKQHPEEVMLFKFRKHPWSVYLKWLGEEGRGREVVFVKDHFDNKIHTLLASGDVPLVPAGKRMSFALDSILVRSACRHPITEAGLGATLERCGKVLAALERGDNRLGTVEMLGRQTRPDYPRPLYMAEHRLPPGASGDLPRGGRRLMGFDVQTGLPTLVQTFDDRGQEVEYYRYDRLQHPVGLDDNDFSPDLLWGDRNAARR